MNTEKLCALCALLLKFDSLSKQDKPPELRHITSIQFVPSVLL